MREPRALHRRIPGYEPTPLLPLPRLAAELGLGEVRLKFERERFGLPAFKILGALWAVYRWLETRLGDLDGRWSDLDELRALAAGAGPLTLVTATDGNHGRGVARVAALLGFSAAVFVPQGTARSRIDAIASEGASVEEVDGDYDAAVARAASLADATHLVVSDTSWKGYRDIPGWIAEGYSTIFAELDEQAARPDVLLVPVGVGALAQAALTYYGGSVAVVSVEPADAACVLASLEAGELVTVPGPHRSMMVGLNCGTPSELAWPVLRDGLAAAVAIEDAWAERAIRLLADDGLMVGETGAASLAALLALRTDEEYRPIGDRLGLGPGSTVVLLATEGVTDPVNHARVLAR